VMVSMVAGGQILGPLYTRYKRPLSGLSIPLLCLCDSPESPRAPRRHDDNSTPRVSDAKTRGGEHEGEVIFTFS
jgi:hypothetical protein